MQNTIKTLSPFHDGEIAIQTRAGVRDDIEPWARQVVRSYMPDQHREFFAQLPFIVVAARDAGNRPWVTLLTGKPGFVQSPDSTSLQISSSVAPGDALDEALLPGADIGILGIDLETRRRNRANGKLSEATGFCVRVGQSFGNCPQYITERAWRTIDVIPSKVSVSRQHRLDRQSRDWVSGADTLFIGSGRAGDGDDSVVYGMDASHRGGPAGFVKVQSDTRIAFPDYAGNNHFNTLGNIFVDPRVGLLFVDFSGGSLLQVTGKASVMWNDIDLFMYPGAQRLVVVDIEEIVRLDSAVPLRWSAPRGTIRSLRLADRIRESENVTSFVFKARDDGDLPDFRAGQYLPIEIGLVGYDQPAKRTYSLSNAPGQSNYRITVKREQNGTVSRHLHDNLEIGAIVNAGSPEGEFTLQQGRRPVALVSAGVGVTPMVSMLHALVAESTERPVYFIHGARNGAHHALANEVEEVARENSNVKLHVVYSQPRAEDRLGLNYHQQGYVDGKMLMQLIPADDADFYLCGPPSFLAEIVAALTDRGIREERVHIETFGPSIP